MLGCPKIKNKRPGIYILVIPLSKLKKREEFEGGLHEKRKGKGGKEEENDKTHIKIPL